MTEFKVRGKYSVKFKLMCMNVPLFLPFYFTRFAKRQIDGRAYFGGSLHVCYAPEMESISETRNKLIQRRRDVARRCVSDDRMPNPTFSKLRCSTKTTFQVFHLDKVLLVSISKSYFCLFRAYSTTGGCVNHTVSSSSHSNCVWNGQETKHDPRVLAPAESLEKVYFVGIVMKIVLCFSLLLTFKVIGFMSGVWTIATCT